ncbi:MAG: double-strand break repair protein AddB [bacterium]
MGEPQLFYLPPGVDFASQLVLGLRERLAGQPPEAMARVALYVNSQRMRRRVTQVMVAEGAGFLPRILVVSELGADPVLAGFAPQVSDLRRRLELAKLIKGLLRAQPELAPMVARFDLADSLADLFAELQDEAVSPDALAALDVSGHSAHWARTQAFLQIVTPFSLEQGDPQSRQREAVRRLAALWQAVPPSDPVVIAGSTGSRGTTALLMQAIAGLATGAVVVPGFDPWLPGPVWRGMNEALTDEDHPQYRFRRLMDALDVPPTAFRPWRAAEVADAARNQVVSLALRPAPVTDQWLVEGQSLPDLGPATAGLTLVEASHPRQEAVTVALILRDAVVRGQRAALITSDRGLTRRVAAALARWGIAADDSAGSPLALSAPGRLLRHVAVAFCGPLTGDHLLTLLKHPLAATGGDRPQHLLFTRRLEMELRRNGPAFPAGQDILNWAGKPGREDSLPWAEALAQVMALLGPSGEVSLSAHVARHVAATEALAGNPGALWLAEAGFAAAAVMDQIRLEAPFGDEMSAQDYRVFFDSLIARGEVRGLGGAHPLVAFYGHREAREMHADIVVLGGLTDGVWPAAADPDPWLNRKMRKEAGLLLPERQIGLAAHDFQQAIAARSVVLTRAVRNAEAETVPSRWLNRLCNLLAGLPDKGGPEALAAMRQRGRVWLKMADRLDLPSVAQRNDPRLAPAVRPRPRPPVGLRPHKLSLTRISTLIRDPYAIYARYILNLKPLDPLRQQPNDRDRGTVVHKILERFVKERPEVEPAEAAHDRLMRTAAEALAEGTPFPSARVLWLARLQRAAGHLLRQDGKYGGVPVLVEQVGSIGVSGTGFTLFGTPDRIDRLPDGRLQMIDYKTGSPPTKAQQEAFDKQLLLAAAMAERGGFAELGPSKVARISYVGLGSGDKAVEDEVTSEQLNEQWARFCLLISAYQTLETGYTARRAVFEARYPLDYDHLSRFGEWQMSDRAVGIWVGGDDD